MIEEYMEESCYRWKKYSEFMRYKVRYVVVSESNPSGEESALYLLHEKDNKIYNDRQEVVYGEEEE